MLYFLNIFCKRAYRLSGLQKGVHLAINVMNMIETRAAEFRYSSCKGLDEPASALADITLDMDKGDWVAVIGKNGSGKSTLARLFNGLLVPSKGVVRVQGLDTRDGERIWDVRKMVGVVFQDPDTQIIGTSVEEDTAFGPENLGLPSHEIISRVREALEAVGMEHRAGNAPHLLSGGEKQKVALAGILALKPDCIILDEATAMMDQPGKNDIMAVIRRLNREAGVTVVQITHDMEEAALADRVLVMDNGRIILDGSPEEVFSEALILHEAGLELPSMAQLFDLLNQDGFDLPRGILNMDAAVEAMINNFPCIAAHGN